MSKREVKDLSLMIQEIPELKEVFPHFTEMLSREAKDSAKEIKRIFEDLIDKFNRNGGTGSNINFYPSENTIGCKIFCLSIATDKFGWRLRKNQRRTGFKGLIKELLAYWYLCGATNQITIIITLDWDDEEFNKEWRSAIEAYASRGKTVKIFEVIESQGAYIERFSS